MKRLLGLLLLSACGRTPEPVRPVAEEFIEVGYPPPAAQIEEFDQHLAGRPECRWLDGHYEWRGRRWQWISGAWVIPPAGCLLAPGLLMWGQSPHARLYYTPPRWYRASGTSPCNPPVLCQKPPRAPR